ncbi:NAD(P)/FAD-dependent oxidoreductase [Sphingomonas sp.]|uniref:dihydrolipoyl dehydrogenase family protein n=1 Tax=Sphingomonas sp. TaxID=28214 RepID=UPI00286B163B|nr:NAD(P)/FAD-dependent oxidoreductase [Sphingomonas sp.]
MSKPYDLIVIGSGTAAQVAIARVHARGWRIAVIDHRPFGGTCALRGCDPKKMLVSGEEAVDAAHRMHSHGISGALRIEWPALMAFKQSFTDPIPARQAKHYADLGVDAFQGLARFTAPDRIAVNECVLVGRNILIATGASPVPLGIAGEDLVSTSDDFLEAKSLPRRIVLIGGGYIAAEFSHLAARAGSQVTILQRGTRLLPPFDGDVVGWLMPSFDALGITVHTGVTADSIKLITNGLTVTATSPGGTQIAVTAEMVVHAAGRAPDLAALDLAAGDVAVDEGRLKLTPGLQSVSNPRVYAAGDAARSGPPLTPVSSHDARVVTANMLDDANARPDYNGVPSVAFTVPPIAAVGLSEAEARAKERHFKINAASVPNWFTARRLNEAIYGYKVLVEKDSDLILGAHLVGPGADEVINLFALAIRNGLTAKALRNTMFAYPTAASDIGYMLD